MIETLIVIAIIGIATTLAIPLYQVYTIRAQVAQGLVASGQHKTAITAYFDSYGNYPIDNATAELAPPDAYSSKYIDSIAVDGAVISIHFGNRAHQQINGRSVTLTANDFQGSVHWTCSSGGSIPDDHLPPACR